ncbi:MAG: 3-phosphoshikimate 1-carboxyvinyltransferase [Gammaproteobacteria bacterium]|nr:3-phosphoshikimate 1-carboxyvinyltransferase [Gammaproteobacteria bacterium]
MSTYYTLNHSTLSGTLSSPPSKSHTLRALLFASLATGQSRIQNILESPDTIAMIDACQQLGATVKQTNQLVEVTGVAGQPRAPDNVIDAGNSGQVLRFVGAIAALTDAYTVLTGDHSVRFNRPVKPLMKGLSDLGATCISTKNDFHAPLIIKGPIRPGHAVIQGEDSQPVSGLLIASAFLKGETNIEVKHPGEKPWVGLTLAWFDRLGIQYKHDNFEHYTMAGHAIIDGFDYTVPGDFSSIAYPIVAAIITQSQITIDNIDMNDAQGDKKIINTLINMGANITIEKNRITVHPSGVLKACTIDVNDMIDALPILAVVGCYAKGTTHLINAGIARKKESDRLKTITEELKKMQADITETEDSLIIKGTSLKGAVLKGHDDHRIAMALSVAALGTHSPSTLLGVHCIAKSYPNFYDAMTSLGCAIQVHT